MQKHNQQITDKKIIEEILSHSQICRIAMIDDMKPYLLPFNYGYRDHCIYIHSAPEGKKIDVLKKNNNVCFEIEQKAEIVKDTIPCKWATIYRSVVGYGKVDIITNYEQKKKALDIILAHNGGESKNRYQDNQIKTLVILKVNITKLTAKQSSNWNQFME